MNSNDDDQRSEDGVFPGPPFDVRAEGRVRTKGAAADSPFWRRPQTLFALTLVTVFFAGVFQSPQANATFAAGRMLGYDTSDAFLSVWAQPFVWFQGATFALALLGILLAHEMGHYLSARREGVAASPPYFIPFLPPLGTLGAVIRLHFERTSPDSLMRIAVNGPFGGMIVALPVLLVGLSLSRIEPLPMNTDELVFMGNGLLIQVLQNLICGVPGPGSDVVFHPLAFAGWAGCLVTAINLLPIGQLDGGHVSYVLGSRHAGALSRLSVAILLVGGFFYIGWWVFAFIAGRLIGVDHPDTVQGRELSARGYLRALLAALLLLVTLPLKPISDNGVENLIVQLELLSRYLLG